MVITKSAIKRSKMKIRPCYEIAQCSLDRRYNCDVFRRDVSCWLYVEECPCPSSDIQDCCHCDIYEEHKKDLLNLNLNPSKKQGKLYIIHIYPIIKKFIDSKNGDNGFYRRRERVIKRIALNMLKEARYKDMYPIEKFLYRLCCEMFNHHWEEV